MQANYLHSIWRRELDYSSRKVNLNNESNYISSATFTLQQDNHMTKKKDFFLKQTPSSRIKASIVAEYFPQYCKILMKSSQQQIRYLDLFAGPGIYKDGSHSTPLLLGKACAEDPALSSTVYLMFNDMEHSKELEANFTAHFPKGTFSREPIFGDKTVGKDQRITEYLMEKPTARNLKPTLLFFDPWGYKEIDTTTLANFLSHWGNEIFLFVNIKRIHAAIQNDLFDDLMKSLFPTSYEQLKSERRYTASVYERLDLIMENLANEFRKVVGSSLFHCAFRFQEEDSKTTSHYIIHFTKHQKGFELIKQVYYDFDNIGATLGKDGDYTFDAKNMNNTNGIVFSDQNIATLAAALELEYKGKSGSAKSLFEKDNPKRKHCGSHYAQTLRYMVEQGKLSVKFADGKEHRVSVLLTDECIIKFL